MELRAILTINEADLPQPVMPSLPEYPKTLADFGAVGDGVTDDTDALQSYFDYCGERGVTAWIENGVYMSRGKTMTKPNDVIGNSDSSHCYPPVLDACCGGKRFWFNRDDPRAFYVDQRCEVDQIDKRPGRKPQVIAPDWQGDFRELPFPDNTFWHVVFDPPHRTTLTSDSDAKTWLVRQYGRLTDDWRAMLRDGFLECFRVLKPQGTLVFKWCDYDVPVGEILKLTPYKPLYGHRSGKQSQTHWVTFIKCG